MRFDSTILNGLPVVVIGRQQSAEPDCGYFFPYFEIDDITFPSGHSIPQSVWNRARENGDFERLNEEGLDASRPDPDYLYQMKRDGERLCDA